MAKIRGRPGKTAGSPAEGVKFEQEIYMTAAEMADMLRGLADEVEARGLEGEGVEVQRLFLVATLVHAAIDQETRPRHLDQIAGAGDLLGRPQHS